MNTAPSTPGNRAMHPTFLWPTVKFRRGIWDLLITRIDEYANRVHAIHEATKIPFFFDINDLPKDDLLELRLRILLHGSKFVK